MSDREFLIERNIQDVVKYLITERGCPISEAMSAFYQSVTFEKLLDEETGLYLESPAYIYGLYKDEVEHGGFVQTEV